MRWRRLGCCLAAYAFLAPTPLPAQAIRGLPPEVQAVHRDNARLCAEVGGKLSIERDYVWRTDFNGDGKTDYVLDQHALICTGALSIYGGSAGIWYNIFVSSGARYVRRDVIGDDGRLVREGKRTVFTLAVKDGGRSRCRWSGKTIACGK